MSCHWPHWKAKSWLWALAVSHGREGGRVHQFYLVSHWHFLISAYYLTVSNGCSLTTLKSKEFTLSSGSFKWEGGREGLSILPGVTLTFPYIFLLFDHFEWVLIDCIEKCRVHSELWQFWMGGWGGGPPQTHTLTNKWSDLISCSLW